jgi:hypothetical protein
MWNGSVGDDNTVLDMLRGASVRAAQVLIDLLDAESSAARTSAARAILTLLGRHNIAHSVMGATGELGALFEAALPQAYAEIMGGGVVYFIQAESGGLIKIGKTANLRQRFKAIQSNCPQKLRILAIVSQDTYTEVELHVRFAEYRKHGEWFESHEDILAFIESVDDVRP